MWLKPDWLKAAGKNWMIFVILILVSSRGQNPSFLEGTFFVIRGSFGTGAWT